MPADDRPALPAPDLPSLVAVAVGGAVGALVRTALEDRLPADPGTWPWTTFAVNLAGAFVLAFVATQVQVGLAPARRRLLVGTGFCGALTTFSTLELELLRMLDADRVGLAVLYAVASVGLGLSLALGASRLVRRGVAAR